MARFPFTFFTDEIIPNQKNLSKSVNSELVQYVLKKCCEAGYDNILVLADALGASTKHKTIRAFEHFVKTGQLPQYYLHQLTNLIQIDESEIKRLNEDHFEMLAAGEKCFVSNFELITRYSQLVMQDENYRNIAFYGLTISSAWIGRHRPLTLGELFFHYAQSDWIMPDCCGEVYVFNAGGSPLSGTNTYRGYCRCCRKIYTGSRPSFGEIIGPYMNKEPDFPYIPSNCTIEQLVKDLQNISLGN